MIHIFVIVFCISLFIIFNTFFIMIQTQAARKNMKRNVTIESNMIGTNKVPLSRLSVLNIDNMDILEDYVYDLFIKFENAINSLDYNTMASLATSKLYSLYHTDLSLNAKYGRKKIIKDIERKKVLVYDIFSSDERQMLYTIIEVEYVSYTINKDGKIVSGGKQPVKERFEVIFAKKYTSDEVIKCPNCGNSVLGSRCNYCRTDLRNQDFKIESIKKIV